jgi:hypothetical protein
MEAVRIFFFLYSSLIAINCDENSQAYSVRDFQGSNQETSYNDRIFMVFLSLFETIWHNISNYTPATSINFISNWIFINNHVIGRHSCLEGGSKDDRNLEERNRGGHGHKTDRSVIGMRNLTQRYIINIHLHCLRNIFKTLITHMRRWGTVTLCVAS